MWRRINEIYQIKNDVIRHFLFDILFFVLILINTIPLDTNSSANRIGIEKYSSLRNIIDSIEPDIGVRNL